MALHPKAVRAKTVDPVQRLRQQVVSMTNAELATVRENAERLSKPVPGESPERQKRAATAWEVISLVDAEIGSRKVRKLAPGRG